MPSLNITAKIPYIWFICSSCHIPNVFYIAVYKSSVEMTTESEMQTVAVGSDETSTQTDSSEWMRSSDTQTSCSELVLTGTQTDPSQWLHCEATQTDAGVELHVVGTQTQWSDWLHCASVQTDCSYWQSTASAQTDIKQLSSSAAQTKEMRIDETFADAAVDTQANLGTQVMIICCTFHYCASGCAVCSTYILYIG